MANFTGQSIKSMSTTKITTHLKLPFQFNEQQLLTDLNKVLQYDWKAHFNTMGYEGSWNSIALYAPNGDPKNILAMHDDKRPLAATPIMQSCDYFREVLAQFHCPLLSVRLLNLGAGAYIKPHRDHELGYEDDCFRLHVPITTNPQVSFVLNNQELPMQPGECWYTNVNYVHSVANKGQEDRIHLVFDGARNVWSDELFFSLAPAESFRAAEPAEEDAATLQRMIEELELGKIPGTEGLIAELRAKLAKA